MTDPKFPDLVFKNSCDEVGGTTAGRGRVRFPLVRWVLAPRTTWQARRLAADFGEGMDARTAWVTARLARHPEDHGLSCSTWTVVATGPN